MEKKNDQMKQGQMNKQQEKNYSSQRPQKGNQQQQSPHNDVLTKENLPDATNENKGKMGSGQRQDSN